MIEFVDKKEEPLFIRFKVINENFQKTVLLLWQDAWTGSCIYSELVTINNNYIYFSEINKGLSFFKNDILFKIIDLNQQVLFTHLYKKLPFEKPGTVLYVSQNTNTGYGYASRNYIYQLINNGYKVDWKIDELGPCNFTPSTNEEKIVHNTIVTSIKNEYDYVIIHHVPDTWNDFLNRYNNKFNFKKI